MQQARVKMREMNSIGLDNVNGFSPDMLMKKSSRASVTNIKNADRSSSQASSRSGRGVSTHKIGFVELKKCAANNLDISPFASDSKTPCEKHLKSDPNLAVECTCNIACDSTRKP